MSNTKKIGALLKNNYYRLLNNSFAKDTAILSLGTIGGQVMAIAAIPIMSRLYSPTDFGILAIFTALANIITITITLRYETAIITPKNDEESLSITLLSSILALAFGIFLTIAIWALPDKSKSILGIAILGNWAPVAALAGIVGALLATGSAWLNRKRAYSKLAQLRFTQSVIATFAGLALGYYGFGSGLMLAQIIASCMALAIFGIKTLPRPTQLDGRSILTTARRHSAAPRFLLPAAMLDVITLQLPIFLISDWFGSGEAGQFSMAWRVLTLPISLVCVAIGQVFFQRFSQAWPDAISSKNLLLKTWKTLALIGITPTIILITFGEQIFKLTLGDTWEKAGVIASIMAPMMLGMLISSPTSSTYLVLGLQKYSLLFGISSFFYRPLCIWIGFKLGELLTGLLLLVILEVIQNLLYQYLAWKKIK